LAWREERSWRSSDGQLMSFVLHSMKKFQSLIVAAVVLVFSIAALGGEPKREPATIGTAEMKADGTIVLRLRAELPGGGSGEGELVYPSTHPEYKKILEHISPIAPGQTVLVRPWLTP
jgi:hypothetical protein